MKSGTVLEKHPVTQQQHSRRASLCRWTITFVTRLPVLLGEGRVSCRRLAWSTSCYERNYSFEGLRIHCRVIVLCGLCIYLRLGGLYQWCFFHIVIHRRVALLLSVVCVCLWRNPRFLAIIEIFIFCINFLAAQRECGWYYCVFE